MTVTTVSTKGQIVIPAWIRKSLNLRPKSKLIVKLSEDKQRVLVEPLPEDPIESACGFLAGELSLTRAFLEQQEMEREQESKTLS